MAAETSQQELDRLKTECGSMVSLLKELEEEELDLQRQVKVLARESLLCGYQPHLLEPRQAPKRRRSTMVSKKKAAAAENNTAAGS